MKKLLLTVIFLFSLFSANVKAEIVVDGNKTSDLYLSIYNNIALVKETRDVKLQSGANSVLFDEVTEMIYPESVIVNAEGIVVKEQNYNYPMLSPENLAKEYIGKIVKTAIWDVDKGKNVYDKARIIDVYSGKPVLQFGYGVEFDYPGRIIWDDIPTKMRAKPSLFLNVFAQESGDKILNLMYLTGGLSWRANYVAEFLNEREMKLKSWVSISNNSGIDFVNADVQLVAGNANVVKRTNMQPMMLKSSRVEKVSVNDSITDENVGEYYVYTLPEKTSVANNQTKQISLLTKDNIKYQKEYYFLSPLYLDASANVTDFKKQNTDVVVKLSNNDDANLGQPLPAGMIRFYDYDSNGNMLFVGENEFAQMAVGENTEIKIGKSFDVVVSGKIVDIKKIADNTFEAEVNISVMNAKKTSVQVDFNQNMFDDWDIVSENIKGIKLDANTVRWNIEVPAKASSVLNFKVRIVKINE